MPHRLRSLIPFSGIAALVALLVAPAFAANIAWVSFHGADSPPSAGAVANGHTVAPDKGYTDLLTANGHTVTRVLTSDAPNVPLLNTFDLVIIGRSVNSAHYELDAETAAWHSITAPMINMSGYTLRSNRLGFTTGTTIPDTTGDIRLTVTNPSHPIFAGIALDGTNTMVNPYAGITTFNMVTQRGISVNNNPLAGGGQLLAKVGTPADPGAAGTGLIIAKWSPGAMMGTVPSDTLGGHRLVFLSGSREQGSGLPVPSSGSETAGLFDLHPDGARMFLNAVNFMAAIPEPSTTSLALLAMAGLGAIRRKAQRPAA
jgi:hypothetical protein